ncbi:MAG: hypothetical protein EOP56_09495 [Sphingobacteriales bacterium]|nr:MAG: hypothetical protein EOP56_09495 [Sphingobacteriales bacterium]
MEHAHHTGNSPISGILLMASWATAVIAKMDKGDISFILSCAVSLCAIWHYIIQIRNSKKNVP